jgi:hypothetical protein
MLAAARDAGWAVGNDVGVEYVSRVPGPPLDGLIDDLYYLEGPRRTRGCSGQPGASPALSGAPLTDLSGDAKKTAATMTRHRASGCVCALGFRNLTNYIARSLLETGAFKPQLHPRS